MNIVYDIETKPNPKFYEKLLASEPKFDPDSVAVGNLKDEEKIKKKIIDAGIAHEKKMIEWREKQKKTCCLDPDLGQLSAIGVMYIESGKKEIVGVDTASDEKEALHYFWSTITNTRSKGCLAFGWNTDGFDLPFLFGRSRLLGVGYDATLINNYRYFHPSFVDLHKVWTFGAYGKFCKLEKACEALGYIQPDLKVHGGTFHEYYDRGGEDRELAKKYLENDLDMTYCVAQATHGVNAGLAHLSKEEDAFDAHK
jgi:predicted PolB exonuclease-like 3'-5' exonuclease